jgi:hypothetical protein
MTGVFGGERTPKKRRVAVCLNHIVFHRQSCVNQLKLQVFALSKEGSEEEKELHQVQDKIQYRDLR